MRRRLLAVLTALVAAFVLPVPAAPPAGAVTIPVGFSDVLVGSVSSPTALAFTPDGRMLVITKGGKLFVARAGTIATTAALDLSARVCTESERGLLGVAVDPAFATNGFVYLYYTAPNGTGACPVKDSAWPLNRVTRVVLGATDVVDPASEVVLFTGIPSVGGNHNAGDLGFGLDGMLYVSVGDSGCDYAAITSCGGDNDASRDTNVALGKILRISPADGSAPADNPFFGPQPPCRDDGFTTAGDHCPETWAWGFRNPFRFAFGAGHLYVNDVGQSSFEEVDDVVAGQDYGWNLREGKCVTGSTTNCPAPPPGLTDPILAYGRADGCRSITGGAFAPASWPEAYRGDYVFADYVCGKIFRLEGSTRVDFATALGSNSAVHLEIGPDAALYYTTFAGGGQIRKIAPAVTPPADGFVSDRAWVSAVNGYGPVERDRSNGGWAAGDGAAIRLNGVVAAKGLGVHAASTVTFAVGGGGFTSFVADVGVDDECRSAGSVVFQVLVDGVKQFDSGTMTGASVTKSLSVSVSGASQLVLKVTNVGDGNGCDHADWANARLVGGSTSTTVSPSTTTPTSVPTTTPSTVPPTTTPSTIPPTTTPTSAPTGTTAPPLAGVFVSDRAWVSAVNGYGPVERDRSNGGWAAGDGAAIRLNGVVAAKGLGVHAASTVTFAVGGGGFTSFVADVGVDDECRSAGSVVFQVLVDGVKQFDSGTMTGASVTKSLSVSVSGASQLVLKVTNAGDGNGCDHADWANARLV